VKLIVTYTGIINDLKTSVSNVRSLEANCTVDKYSATANGDFRENV
jgi:hypothetical protein